MAKTHIVISKSPTQTKQIARRLARRFYQRDVGKRAFIIALQGNLGSGKTTFVQGLASGLGIRPAIKSPTFIIMKSYRISRRFSSYSNFFHIDAYRIVKPRELEGFGWLNIAGNPKNIIVIEWPERLKFGRRSDMVIRFEHVGPHSRKIIK